MDRLSGCRRKEEIEAMTEEEIEREVAGIIEPQAWEALGKGLRDSIAYDNRRISSGRKARAVLSRLRELGWGSRQTLREEKRVPFARDEDD